MNLLKDFENNAQKTSRSLCAWHTRRVSIVVFFDDENLLNSPYISSFVWKFIRANTAIDFLQHVRVWLREETDLAMRSNFVPIPNVTSVIVPWCDYWLINGRFLFSSNCSYMKAISNYYRTTHTKCSHFIDEWVQCIRIWTFQCVKRRWCC